MPIGIENQYIFNFDFDGQNDFIPEDDLKEFLLIEEVGNILPTFELTFVTRDASIIPKLNPRNPINVSFGRGLNDLQTTSLVILNTETVQRGTTEYLISCTGTYNATGYQVTKNLKTRNMTSVEAIKDAVSDYFTVKSNIDKSNDKMVWLQPSTSNKKFVNKTWLHSHVKDSFISVGITSSGEFIIKDMRKDFKEVYDWRFTRNPINVNDLPIETEPITKIRNGFINAVSGFDREKVIYNLETGEEHIQKTSTSPEVSMSRAMAREENVGSRFTGSSIQNDNVHESYHESYDKNYSVLSAFGTVVQTISFFKLFKNIKILDKIFLLENDLNSNEESVEFNSGVYYAIKVVRNLVNKELITTVVFGRENLNNVS
jgi:hypothetical protein